MKTLRRRSWACALAALCLATVCAAQDQPRTYTFGVKINGELCGYADVVVSMVDDDDGGRHQLMEQTMIFSATVLGLNVDREITVSFHVDPTTGKYTYLARRVRAEDLDLRSEVTIEDGVATFTPLLSNEVTRVELPPDIALENSLFLPHIAHALAADGAGPRETITFDPDNPQVPIQTVVYTRVGAEALTLADAIHETVIVDSLNKVSGAKMRMWLDTTDGLMVKVNLPNGMVVALTDPSVRDRIQRVDADSLIMTKAETDIADVSAITFMRVRATLEPIGPWLDAADLTVPGQRFEGTVVENRVEGVFEIEHPRYDGAGAPPYPPDFTHDAALAPYLAPGPFVESDDPVLVERARTIADGSADAWEAAKRLSAWVAENIGYEIPGGIFARKVYDMRAGECGGHSVLLAAFCRGVGIPARAVWGCMYTPMGGGSFGQHAWTEIYMGRAGWIPVDSTAHEIDYVDSGHIRLGTFGSGGDGSVAISLGARKMEVLDYRVAGGDGTGAAAATAAGKYVAYVGAYDVPGREEPFRVVVKDGRLGVDIPGQMVLPMNDPDENGRWVCALTNLVSCAFERDEAGNVSKMIFHEIVRMRRRSDPETIPDDVPADLRPYLGGYFFPAANMEFSVIWDEGALALWEPQGESTRHFEATDDDGRWTIEDGAKEIRFIRGDDGKVITMSIDAAVVFPRRAETVATTE